MADSTRSLLESLHTEITEALEGDTSITIASAEGNPPDKYTITYTIPSVYKDSNGDIRERDTHVIVINIPIGYPHFPPSCKPLTPLYHPDFDPSAICIGDFWKKTKSMTELINYIGKMIGGETYSTENAFNSDAAEWYIENQDRLPFTDTGQPSIDSLSPENDISPPRNDEELDPLDIDTLEESDLNLDVDYLETEQIESQSTIDLSEAGTTDIDSEEPESLSQQSDEDSQQLEEHIIYDIDRMEHLLQKKRFHELQGDIDTIRKVPDIDDPERIIQQITDNLSEAGELFEKGLDFENQGLAGQALQCYQDTRTIVSDYPNIDEGIERVTASLELLSGETIEAVTEEEYKEIDPSQQAKDSVGEKAEKKKKEVQLTFFDEKEPPSKLAKILRLIIPFCLLGATVYGVHLYLTINTHWKRAHDLVELCEKSLLLANMSQARSQCNQARENLNQVRFLHLKDKKSLNKKIEGIIASISKAQSSSTSKSDVYITEAQNKAKKELDELLHSAAGKMAQTDWQGAINMYQQGLRISDSLTRVDEKLIIESRKNLRLATINMTLENVWVEMTRAQWDSAIDMLNSALKLVKDESTRQLLGQSLTLQLTTQTSILRFQIQAGRQMNKSNWATALGYLEKAKTLADTTPQLSKEIITQLKKNIDKVRLYYEIETGKLAFTEKQWEKALVHYEKALHIIQSSGNQLTEMNTDQYLAELSRIILRITITRDRRAATRYSQKKQFDQATVKLESLIKLIENSRFSTDEQFIQDLEDLKQEVITVKSRHLVAVGEQALKERFKTLFIKHYPGTIPDSLSRVKVTFVEKRGDDLLYNIQCIESKGGRPARLVLDYFYNPSTKKLTFYSGQ